MMDMQRMDSLEARLDSLVSRMNHAAGNQKIAAMAAVINELVAQRRAMREHMRQMMESPLTAGGKVELALQGGRFTQPSPVLEGAMKGVLEGAKRGLPEVDPELNRATKTREAIHKGRDMMDKDQDYPMRRQTDQSKLMREFAQSQAPVFSPLK